MVRTRGLHTEKSKGKAVASEPNTQEGRKKRARDDAPGPSDPNAAPQDPLRESLLGCDILPTRFLDWETMGKLGVKDDMEMLFANMGIQRYMHLREYTHEQETLLFIKSFKAHLDYDNKTCSGFSFRIKGTTYELSDSDIREIYGFMSFRIPPNNDELPWTQGLMDLWHQVASGSFRLGKVKASNIRNPTIRLVQKALGFAFFGRHLVGPLTTEEWRMISFALRPFTRQWDPPIASTPAIDPTIFFIGNLIRIQDAARAKKTSGWPLCIGGALTPIFRHCRVPLRSPTSTIPLIDMAYLYNCHFLSRGMDDSLRYKYRLRGRDHEMVLPNPDQVNIANPANVLFQYALDDRVDEDQPEEQQEVDDAPADGAHVYGAKRYQQRIQGVPRTPMERELTKQNKLLQRWVKWQGRTIRKMANAIKSLKGRMRSVEKHTGHVSTSYLDETRSKSRHDRDASSESSNPSLDIGSPPDSDAASGSS